MTSAGSPKQKPLARSFGGRLLRFGLALPQKPRSERALLGVGLWLALVMASGAAAPRPTSPPRPAAAKASAKPLPMGPLQQALPHGPALPSRPLMGPSAPPALAGSRPTAAWVPAGRFARGPGKAGGAPKRRAGALMALTRVEAPSPSPSPAVVAQPSPRPVQAVALPTPAVRAGVAVVERLSWRGFGLVIQADSALSPDVFTLHSPERFVVDLPSTEFGEPDQAQSLLVNSMGVRQVRMAAHGGAGVRLVLDVADASRFRVVQFADRKALVIARSEVPNARLAELMRGEGAPPGVGFNLARVGLHHRGDRVELEVVAPKPFKLEVKDPRPSQLVLRIPGARFTGLFGPSGNFLRSAKARTGSDGALELAMALQAGHYQLSRSSEQGGKVQRLSWWRLEPRAFANRPLVVIDPGHGGADPGALSPGGFAEKDLCLSLALQFQAALRAKRINALLTRSSDEEVLLAPRLDFIDQVGADAFVSLHANAHTTGSQGLESYWREPPGRALATAMQSAMVAALGRPDRGVKHERLYVLRHQRVPSTLVEVGFITNPNEAAWMATADFKRKATGALVLGLERFWAAAPQNLGVLPLGLPAGALGGASLGGLQAP